MRRIIIIEEDDGGREIKRVGVPYRPSWEDGYICPICGKHVGSMEVHPCNQPYCGGVYGKRS